MLNRREFGKKLSVLMGLGFFRNFETESIMSTRLEVLLGHFGSTRKKKDFLTANYQHYFALYGVSSNDFSFDKQELVLTKITLRLNPNRFCLMNFNLNSQQKRFKIINTNTKIELSSLASHGINSGNNSTFSFSNALSSFKSSLGIYVTGTHYVGRFGPSIILHGVSSTNDRVFDRSIVLHGANYCGNDHIKKYGFLGRSLGCIALPKKQMIAA